MFRRIKSLFGWNKTNILLVGKTGAGKTSLLTSLALYISELQRNGKSYGSVVTNGSHVIDQVLDFNDSGTIDPTDFGIVESVEFESSGNNFILTDVSGETFIDMKISPSNESLFEKLDAIIYIIDRSKEVLDREIFILQGLAEQISKKNIQLNTNKIIFCLNKSDLWNERNNWRRNKSFIRKTRKELSIPLATLRNHGIKTSFTTVSCLKDGEDHDIRFEKGMKEVLTRIKRV